MCFVVQVIFRLYLWILLKTGGMSWQSMNHLGLGMWDTFAGSSCFASSSSSPSSTSVCGKESRLQERSPSPEILNETCYYFEEWSAHSASSHPRVSLSGSMGDCHPAVRGAVDSYDPRCNSARSVERSGVLPQSQMGETEGDQRECFSPLPLCIALIYC